MVKDKIEAYAFKICKEAPRDVYDIFFKLDLERYVELMLQVGRLEEGRPAETFLDVVLEDSPEAIKKIIQFGGKKPPCPDLYFSPAPGAFSNECMFMSEKGSCMDCWKQKCGSSKYLGFF